MSDLVNELRDLHRNMLGIAYDRSIFLEAADRIDALEAALREISTTVTMSREPFLIKLSLIGNTARHALDKDAEK